MDVKIGTRKSPLALAQADWIKEELFKRGYTCTVVPILSLGERDTRSPLSDMVHREASGIFTKSLEEALLDRRIDCAVHSLKDMPVRVDGAFSLVAFSQRENPADVFLSREAPLSFSQIQDKAWRIGTSSPRRAAQIRYFFPHAQVVDVRGNVGSRLQFLETGKLDALILALAGLKRLFSPEPLERAVGCKGISVFELPTHAFVPAPGQGVLTVEMLKEREDNALWKDLEGLSHRASAKASQIERSLLAALGGGCALPLGALSQLDTDEKSLRLTAFLGGTDRETREKKGVFFQGEESVENQAGLVAKAVQALTTPRED